MENKSSEETAPFLSESQPPQLPSPIPREDHEPLETLTLETSSTDPSNKAIKHRLYTSHLLSTFNSRLFEFAAVLFLAHFFPDTLLPVSVYALVRAGAAICFAPTVGNFIDRGERLRVVRLSIVGQRCAVIVSCLLFWVMFAVGSEHAFRNGLLLTVLCVLACVEKLCTIMNLIAMERDWVVVLAGNSGCGLEMLNSQMRRIDLFCKLMGPLFISVVDGQSTMVAIWVTLGMSLLSVTVEYYAIAKVGFFKHLS